jgi:glycosyltransferase involved in cell wall biosynthesis
MNLVSILLPIHRYDLYCDDAIRSILNQTYKNLELIVIYETYDIKKILQKNFIDSRIIYKKGEGKGLAAALNLGISISKGEFIARMDSDDISLSSRIDSQLEYIIKNNYDICGSNIKTFGKTEYEITFPVEETEIKHFAVWGTPLAHPTILAKSSILKKNLYNETMVASEDYELWIRLLKSNIRISNIDKVLYRYRVHNHQGSRLSVNQIKSDTEIADSYYEFLFNKSDSILRKYSFGRLSSYDVNEIDYLLSKLIPIRGLYFKNPDPLNRIITSIILKNNKDFFSLFKLIRNKYNFNITKKIFIYLLFISIVPISYQKNIYELSKRIYKYL